MQVVDFTNLPRRNKLYAGANGSKISVIYEGQQYMLKFPPLPSKNKEMSYSNSCFSEYLGCQIYESIGIPVQKTMLGTYTVKGKTKIVVACGDFTEPGITLQDFASLKNQIIDSERNGYGTELSDILHTFEEQEAWTPNGSGEDIRKKSLHNATSLTSEELVQYVTGTPLFKAMMDELEARGVNTENIMELYTKDAAFSA